MLIRLPILSLLTVVAVAATGVQDEATISFVEQTTTTNTNHLRSSNNNNNNNNIKIGEEVLTLEQDSFVSAPESNCNAAPDEATCYQTVDDDSSEPCQWCVAGAIPSECMSAEQAKFLPPAVFECKSPGIDAATTKEDVFPWSEKYTLLAKEHEAGAFCDDSSKSISGYIDIKGSKYDENGENKHLFFWMFEKRGSSTIQDDPDDDDTTPFVIWLTGGPGCSSTVALLTENGPCSVNKDGETTSVNPNSWTESAHVLWIDQPAGVGFSYGQETDTNEAMISEDAYYFLQSFFKQYPQYSKNPFFIVGESYAGHYVPAIAHRIHKGNKEIASSTSDEDDLIKIALSGIAIGNGLTSPENQYPWYPEMAYNNSHGLKVVSESVYETMKSVVPKCTALVHECNQGDGTINSFACQSAFLVCNLGLTSPYQATGLNPYDIRKTCDYPPLCYDMSHIEQWLNAETTKQALHVDEKHSHSWQTCNFGINMKFHTDWMKDFSGYVADLLNDGIPALIYAGDVDYICNYLGNRAWTLAMPWKGQSEFQAAAEHDWQTHALARTTADNLLTFLQVYDAGHMVPSDQPEAALKMITTFLEGGTF